MRLYKDTQIKTQSAPSAASSSWPPLFRCLRTIPSASPTLCRREKSMCWTRERLCCRRVGRQANRRVDGKSDRKKKKNNWERPRKEEKKRAQRNKYCVREREEAGSGWGGVGAWLGWVCVSKSQRDVCVSLRINLVQNRAKNSSSTSLCIPKM